MFAHRYEAGNMLGLQLIRQKVYPDIICGITRGGVVVGDVIAKILEKPFIPFIIKKIGVPHNPELAIGAVTYDGIFTLDQKAIMYYQFSKAEIKKLVHQKYQEVKKMQKALDIKTPPEIANKCVLIVDDGIATGATVKAAHKYCVKKKAGKILLATPVIAKSLQKELQKYFFDIIALKQPENLMAVGEYYESFEPVTTKDVKRILGI